MAANITHKEAHEAFVTGYDGTSVTEIAVLVSSAPVSVFARYAATRVIRRLSLDTRLYFAADFLLLMVPMILCFTVLADNAATFLVTLAVSALSLLMITDLKNVKKANLTTVRKILDHETAGKRRPFLTNYRSYVNAASAVCILAVDFVIFPRRLCKTETYGTGLMDVGVAAYVFSNAVVSPEARGADFGCSNLGKVVMRIAKSFRSTSPLWVLGFCRLASIKLSGYHEHVTEYGVHWNFFFTLAIVRVLSTVLYCIVNPRRSWLLAVIVIAVYQYLLSVCGLSQFLLDDAGSRVGLFNANREGVCSCLGYLVLYFAGVELGRFIMRPRSHLRDWLVVLAQLVVVDVFFWCLLFATELFIDRVSRRLANLAYVMWMMAYNVQSIASFLAVDVATSILAALHKQKTVMSNDAVNQPGESTDSGADSVTEHDEVQFDLLEAVNRNGLLYFLLSNVLTGAVNLTTFTMYASTATALIELTLYMVAVSAVAAVLHVYDFTVKFW